MGRDGSGDWTDIGNWFGLQPPTAADDAIINNGGTAQVTGPASANTLILGLNFGGSGTVTVGAGGVGLLKTTTGQLGNPSGSLGTVTVSGAGSTWTNAGNLVIGGSGTGTLTVENGGMVANTLGGFVGNSPGSLGTVTVSGGGSTWTNDGTIQVGASGTGTLTIQNGGTVNSGGGGSIGLAAGSTGTVKVTGPGSIWTNDPGGGLSIGTFGAGTLTIENGGKVINNTALTANIGRFTGSRGTVTVTGAGSTWSNILGVNIGNFGIGTLTIADGGVVTAGQPSFIATNAGATGTLNIGAGSGNPAAAPGTFTTPSLTFGPGTGTLNFNHTSADYVFAPRISGIGTVNVLAGTTTFTRANTYDGATNVIAGALRAGALNTFSPNSPVTVASGGTLDLNGFNQTVPSVTNAGLVNMGTDTLLGTVLTTTSYTGAGGTLALNTFLGTDGSPSDRLIIDGTATGDTGIVVTNAGGPGLLTLADGILVVDTANGGTTAPSAFRLGAPVVEGPFEYTLERGSVTGGNGEAWFLRSALNCALVPSFSGCVGPRPPIPPEPPVPLPNPPIPHLRQEVSLYAAMPVATAIYGRRIIDTLHERMGGNAQVLGSGEDGSYDSTPDGMWGRLIGFFGHRDGEPLGIYGGGPEFDYNFGALQAGGDLYRRESQDGSRDNAGVYAAFGHGEVDVTHNLLGFTFKGGEDKFDAYSLGGYWTHFGPSDWYLDGVLQATWYDASMTGGRGLRDGETHGWGLAASVEGGYPFHFGDGWLIEPQAQLVYQTVDLSDFNDGFADVRYSDEDSLAGRIGARLARTWNLEEPQGGGTGTDRTSAPVRKASVWLRGDLWNEFIAQPTTEFSSANGFVPFVADNLQESTWKLGLGGTWDFASQSTLYANVNYEQSFEGDADAWEGKLGVKVTW